MKRMIFAGVTTVAVLAAVAETVTWTGAESSDWSTAANWSATGGAKVPVAGDDVVIATGKAVLSVATPRLGTVTVRGATLEFKEAAKAAPANLVTKLSATAIVLEESAIVTHITNTMTVAEYRTAGEWQMDGRVWIDCTTLSIDATSAIDVTSRGYAQLTPAIDGVGPGAITNFYGCGAAHGGAGSLGEWSTTCFSRRRWYSATVYSGLPYGDVTAPVWVGSSGSAASNSAGPGWPGGGAVKIVASGRVTINGAIHADSTGRIFGGSNYYGGGSGGSVWIECGSIAGSGAITADGGRGEASIVTYAGQNRAHAAGGGRLAIHYNASQQDAVTAQSLRFSADAPCYDNKNVRVVDPPSDVGTVHFTDDRFLTETFNASVGVSAGEIHCASWTKWKPASLTVNGAWIRLPEGPATNLTLSGALTVSGRGRLDIGGGIQHWDSIYTQNIRPWQRYSCASAPNLSVGSLEISNSGCLRFFTAATNGLDEAIGGLLAVRGDMTVGNDAQLILSSHPDCGAPPHITVGGDATVAAKGRLDANGMGFAGTLTGENGRGPGCGWIVAWTHRQGASHGGFGAYEGGWGQTMSGITIYGDLERPTMAGSSVWISGGGVIWLTVAGHLQFDGVATANSQTPWMCHPSWLLESFSGSGGSICLEARTVGGKGELRASSVRAWQYRWNSGGGRIAVRYDAEAEATYLESNPKPTFLYEASPSTAGQQDESTDLQFPADMGTIYLTDGQLMTNHFTSANFRIGEIHLGDWSTWNPGEVTVEGSQIRLHGGEETIRIGGSLRIRNQSFLGFGGGAYSQRSFHYTSGNAAMRYTKGPGPRVVIRGDVEIGSGNCTATYHLWPCPQLAVYAGEELADIGGNVGGSMVVGGSFTVRTNGVYELVAHPETGPVVRTQSKNVIVDAGGTIEASYRGGRTSANEKCQGAPMLADGKGGGYFCGGGYGGQGGHQGGKFGLPYGDALCPTNMGGGAGSGGYSGCQFDGFGGGCIWIEARSTMTLAGKVQANGCSANNQWSTCGAGGGIYLKCKTWNPDTNTLVIAANGGEQVNHRGDGGGGRVAIWRQVDQEELGDPTVSSEDDQGRGYITVSASRAGANRQSTPGTIRWVRMPPPQLMIIFR